MLARWRHTIERGAKMSYLGIGYQPTVLGRRISVVAYLLAWVYSIGVLVALARIAYAH
jgi:hypothetical protein